MKNKTTLLIFFIIISLFLVSCNFNNKDLSKNVSYGEDSYYTVEKTEISDYIIANGIVQSEKEVIVTHSPIASVDKIYVKIGDFVNEGDLLFEYKESDIQEQIDELNVEYEKLKSIKVYNDSKNERNYQDALEEKERKTAEAQNNIDIANVEYNEQLKKYNEAVKECTDIEEKRNNTKNEMDKLIYEEQYSQKMEEVKELEQSVLQYKKLIEEAETQYDTIVYEAQKNVEAMLDVINDEKNNYELSDLEKQLAEKNAILENTKVYSPVSGIIVELFIEQETTQIDDRTVIIGCCDSLSVTLNVNEEDIQKVEKDMTVEIYLGKNVQKIVGKVTRILHINSDESSTFPVEVSVEENFKDKVFLGMSVTAKIYTEVRENAISVPYECINIDKNDKIYVNRIKEDNMSLEKILVTTGIETSDSIEIISESIKEGDRLIINK